MMSEPGGVEGPAFNAAAVWRLFLNPGGRPPWLLRLPTSKIAKPIREVAARMSATGIIVCESNEFFQRGD
jgi:hypothetical protein